MDRLHVMGADKLTDNKASLPPALASLARLCLRLACFARVWRLLRQRASVFGTLRSPARLYLELACIAVAVIALVLSLAFHWRILIRL